MGRSRSLATVDLSKTAAVQCLRCFDAYYCAMYLSFDEPMKLYASLTSPYARKVRVVLAEKKIEYSFVENVAWGRDSQVSEFNPLGKIPVLIMEDGRVPLRFPRHRGVPR